MLKKLLSLVFMLIVVSTLSAQQTINNPGLVSVDSLIIDESFPLPNLDSCIQLAISNSPLLLVNNEEIVKLVEDLKIQKSSWLNYIQLDGNTRYGLFNQLQLSQSTEGGSDVGVQTAKEQFNYYAGITIKIPFSYFTSNKREQNKIKSGIREIEYKRAETIKEISKVIVSEYFNFKKAYELMLVQQENLQTVRLGFLKANHDLNNNIISIGDFAAASSTYSRAKESYITTKNEYYAQYYLLKLLMGVNDNNIKK